MGAEIGRCFWAFLLKSFTFFEDAEGQESKLSEGQSLDRRVSEEIKEFFRQGVKGLVKEEVFG